MSTTMFTSFSLSQVGQTHSETTAQTPERPFQETSASSAEAPKNETTEFDLLLMAEIRLTSWDGKYTHYLQGFSTIQTVVVWDFVRQQYFRVHKTTYREPWGW